MRLTPRPKRIAAKERKDRREMAFSLCVPCVLSRQKSLQKSLQGCQIPRFRRCCPCVNEKISNAPLDDAARLTEAIYRFELANRRDPNQEMDDGAMLPRELLYARRLSAWVLKLCPDASEELRLASHCQHICRWGIPRNTYEMTRAGYLKWRSDLKKFHAQKAGEILREVGYPEEVIARVQALNLKKNFPTDPESRVLEDALCLVFLQFQFAELAAKTDDDKLINALQKSWKKMTPAAHAEALKLNYGTREKSLIAQALA